ncbi:MAG: DNA primase [Alphaproteobacteria bacterium]|nr:DNA primase [Alphaproteobacteria bacterium]
MGFTPQFLDELRTRVSIVSVVGRKVKLVRKGRDQLGLCPFHNEKTPSFTVNDDKGFYHCFGCGAHGDVIAFEMNAHGLGFREAVERLSGEAGLELPVETPDERERAVRAAGLHDVLEAACRKYMEWLYAPAGRAGLEYLRNRGLDDAAIAQFRLGFAPDGRQATREALLRQGIPEAPLIEAGLLIQPDEGPTYDRFRGRVIFPITDRRGRVVGFGGRALGDAQPKYLNSPDTPLFHKGRLLYNLAQARAAAAEAGTVVAVEGYMDVIALSRAGFRHAVAPLGTALTEEQLAELWRLAPEPILCFDGDKAGRRAAFRAAERALPLLEPGRSLRFAELPAPEDPDSLIKAQGAQAMEQVLARARPLSDLVWRMEIEGRPLDTPERRAALEQALRERVRQIADRSVQQHYAEMFRERQRELFRPQRKPRVAAARGGRFPDPRRDPARHVLSDGGGVAVQVSPRLLRERILLAAAINHPALLELVGERLGGVRFADNDLDNLRQEVLKHLGGASDLDSGGLERHLRSCGFSGQLDTLLGTDVYGHAAFARPGVDIAVAHEGWEDTFTLYLQQDMRTDILEAEERLASDMSEATFQRFLALKRQEGA